MGSGFYQLGGFGLPFYVLGSTGVIIAALLLYLVPVVPNELRDNEYNKGQGKGEDGKDAEKRPSLKVSDAIKVRV